MPVPKRPGRRVVHPHEMTPRMRDATGRLRSNRRWRWGQVAVGNVYSLAGEHWRAGSATRKLGTVTREERPQAINELRENNKYGYMRRDETIVGAGNRKPFLTRPLRRKRF